MGLLTRLFFLTSALSCFGSLKEAFNQDGYWEICDEQHGSQTYDVFYEKFEEVIVFLEKNPRWKQKLDEAKERFIRSKDKACYGTDICGFYEESKTRQQIAFYYSAHFHRFIVNQYKEFNKAPVLLHFLEACHAIEKRYDEIIQSAFNSLSIEPSGFLEDLKAPRILKVIKYLPSYYPIMPHYDGSIFSFLLDSTDATSLLLSPYKSSFVREDFKVPERTFLRKEDQNSILLLPGAFLKQLGINPTPHVVVQSGKTRYATVLFVMRPGVSSSQIANTALPYFTN